jgi:type II secretory pathway predicted ATPase ExeA
LRENPFALTPDPRFLFLAPRQREALSNLRYGLMTPRGFTLLLGEAGTGKTTMVRTILTELNDPKSQYVVISNPTLSRAEFYECLVRELGLAEAASKSKTQFLVELQRHVEARFAAGGLTGLIIDEAQSLPHELLEEIRLLGNIETTTAKLLNIVLAGQPELAPRLNDPSLRQLKQRIALRCELSALTLEETAAYIAGRIRIAGGTPAGTFTRESVTAVHHACAGIPRTINVLCDNALIGGYAAQVKPIPVRFIEEIRRDFDLRPSPSRSLEGALPASRGTSSLARASDKVVEATAKAPASDAPTFDVVPSKKPFSFFH